MTKLCRRGGDEYVMLIYLCTRMYKSTEKFSLEGESLERLFTQDKSHCCFIRYLVLLK